MQRFVNSYLKNFLSKIDKTKENPNAKCKILGKEVRRFLDKEKFEDDASMGVLISDRTIKFYLESQKQDSEN